MHQRARLNTLALSTRTGSRNSQGKVPRRLRWCCKTGKRQCYRELLSKTILDAGQLTLRANADRVDFRGEHKRTVARLQLPHIRKEIVGRESPAPVANQNKKTKPPAATYRKVNCRPGVATRSLIEWWDTRR